MKVCAELIGVPGVEGDAEIVSIALDALSACGLRRHSIGLGDGALYRGLLEAFEVPPAEAGALMGSLMRRDLVGLEARVRSTGLPDALVTVPSLRGGAEVLDRAEELMGEVAATALIELRGLFDELSGRGFAEQVILDLGLVHELGYYTGAVFEIYDPAVGVALGGGGRYDQLIGRFGKPRPACGVALDVQRVHVAQAAEEKMR
jgi:ATP phosphoribosyltransferase regulatory subunit HisZ